MAWPGGPPAAAESHQSLAAQPGCWQSSNTPPHFKPWPCVSAVPSVCRQVNEGVVLAVGPGRRNKEGDIIPPSVKEGDKVLLPEYGGSLIKLDNKE